MLIRSIYGETPEGAVPVEDRVPTKKHFAKQSKGGAPTKRNAKSISPQSKLGGPQQIGFRKESHRTKQVGVAETAP